MSKELLEYKGYQGSVKHDLSEGILFGEVLCVSDTITYSGETLKDLKENFQAALQDYLELCKEVGKEPNKPFKGSFNVRISPEKHKALFLLSKKRDVSINSIVSDAVDFYLKTGGSHVIEKHNYVENHFYPIKNESITLDTDADLLSQEKAAYEPKLRAVQ